MLNLKRLRKPLKVAGVEGLELHQSENQKNHLLQQLNSIIKTDNNFIFVYF